MHKKENIKEFGQLGRVSFVRSSRARRLAIRVNNSGEVRVTIPRSGSMRQAEAFLASREQWVLRSQSRLREQRKKGLKIEDGQIEVRGCRLKLEGLNGEDHEKALEEAVWKAILPPAKEYLVHRTEMLAREYGIRIEGVRVRKMRTRWGSCSPRDGINLNSWLVLLPEHLSDYVILHELAHTRHRNHGAQFWRTLDQMTGGDSSLLRKELGSYGIMLIDTED